MDDICIVFRWPVKMHFASGYRRFGKGVRWLYIARCIGFISLLQNGIKPFHIATLLFRSILTRHKANWIFLHQFGGNPLPYLHVPCKGREEEVAVLVNVQPGALYVERNTPSSECLGDAPSRFASFLGDCKHPYSPSPSDACGCPSAKDRKRVSPCPRWPRASGSSSPWC